MNQKKRGGLMARNLFHVDAYEILHRVTDKFSDTKTFLKQANLTKGQWRKLKESPTPKFEMEQIKKIAEAIGVHHTDLIVLRVN